MLIKGLSIEEVVRSMEMKSSSNGILGGVLVRAGFATVVALLIVAPVMLIVPNVAATAPYLIKVRDYEKAIGWSPYGHLYTMVSIEKEMYDGSSVYDWYVYTVKLQSVPGIVEYASHWETAHTFANFNVYYAGSDLYDYDPTTTNGYSSSTVSAIIDMRGGAGLSVAYTYQIPYVKVIDYSNWGTEVLKWEHDFNEKGDPSGSPSDSSYLAKPSFVLKTVDDGYALCSSPTNGGLAIQFWKNDNWIPTYYTCKLTSTWYLNALRTGDS